VDIPNNTAEEQSPVKRRRNAFTLIEMLVVIGIILILMVLAVVGYQVVEKSAAANQTKVTLNNLNSMLSELDAAAGATALPVYTYQDSMGNTQVQNVIGAVPNTPDGQVWTVGDVTAPYPSDRYPLPDAITTAPPIANMVRRTQTMIASLMRVPGNANAIKQMPTSRLMKDQNGNPYPIPIILDGWGNPIIYVPSGGIVVYVTTGSGSTPITIKSASNRPFFASAGPDGDFGAVTASPNPTPHGDDNVYSKE
jgi:prepilin-type N-terminal cleavage/methylation domain-containing protein